MSIDGHKTRHAVGEWHEVLPGVTNAARFEVETAEIESWFAESPPP